MVEGLLFATLTGLSWVITGAIVGLAEKRGCGTFRQQLVSSCYSLLSVAAIYAVGRTFAPESPVFSFSCEARGAACMFTWGFLNFWMMVFMGRAMKRGPNGLAWTITQSGLVFPFAMGIAAGRTDFTLLRGLGFVLVLANVAASGLSKGSGGAGAGVPVARWFLPALAAFVLCGLNQCAMNLVSYLPEEVRPQVLERMLWGAVGTFSGWATHAVSSRLSGAVEPDPDLRRKYLFLLKVCGLALVPSLVASFFFHFNALDLLAKADAIAIASPVEINACLLGFFLYGFFVLRERPSKIQTAAFAAGLLGVAFLWLG